MLQISRFCATVGIGKAERSSVCSSSGEVVTSARTGGPLLWRLISKLLVALRVALLGGQSECGAPQMLPGCVHMPTCMWSGRHDMRRQPKTMANRAMLHSRKVPAHF